MNHYEVLGINKNASPEEIRDAYKKLVKKYHPDIYPGDKSFAEKKIKSINEAYEILSDSNSRKEYDEEINPTPVYNYTPPSYTPSSQYSYDNYKRTNNYDNYNNYNNYNYYTNANRKQYYNNTTHEKIYNNVVNSFNKMNFMNKIFILILIFAVYTFFFIIASKEFTSISNKNNDITSSNSTTFITTDKTSPQKNKEDFDINDYYSDEELYEIYKLYYSNYFNSFNEFKEALNEYYYEYY